MNVLRRLFGQPSPVGSIQRPNRDLSGLRRVPWPEDMIVEPVTYRVGTQQVNYVSAAADGPNSDGTMHHAYIGYWPDFASAEEAMAFAYRVASELYNLNGVVPHVLKTRKERNDWARYALGELKKRPR